MRKTCGQVVQLLCALRGITRVVFQMQKLLLFFVGINSIVVRSFYQTFTTNMHNEIQKLTDVLFVYTHNPHTLVLQKLSFKLTLYN
jgi:hypothetical protein